MPSEDQDPTLGPADSPPPLDRPAPFSGPPPLPGRCAQTSSDGPTDSKDISPPCGFSGRLHPLTLVFAVWNVLRGFIIPLLIFLILGRGTFLSGFVFLFIVLPLLFALVRYVSFSYRLESGDLITRQGLFSRVERHIPLARVQDIRIEQGVLHRLLGMADVHVDTAGGQGSEAVLSVLSKAEAERLRSAVLEQKPVPLFGAPGAEAPPLPVRETIRRVSLSELALAGMTSNHLASALAILAVAWGLLDDLFPKETIDRWVVAFTESAGRWAAQAETSGWLVFALGVALALLVGMIVSVAGSIILFYGFTISRRGEDLHRSYGLFTRRSSSLPRRRIQVLKIEEKLLRRLLRLATLRADTAGAAGGESNQAKAGRDVLLPLLPRRDVEGLLPEFFADLPADQGAWRPVSRKAVYRGTFKGSVGCLFLAALSYLVQREWLALWPLLFLPVVYLSNLQSYRHLGYWSGEKYFRTRRGWLSRDGHVVPIRNIQAVVIRQTPFDRRHKVGTILVDTAGQIYTGGGPRIHNVHWEEALRLAWTLARRASLTRYRW
jgi:putative membrane protein